MLVVAVDVVVVVGVCEEAVVVEAVTVGDVEVSHEVVEAVAEVAMEVMTMLRTIRVIPPHIPCNKTQVMEQLLVVMELPVGMGNKTKVMVVVTVKLLLEVTEDTHRVVMEVMAKVVVMAPNLEVVHKVELNDTSRTNFYSWEAVCA